MSMQISRIILTFVHLFFLYKSKLNVFDLQMYANYCTCSITTKLKRLSFDGT